MNTTSASPVEPVPASSSSLRRILVWDAPVRVFHWLMVLSFAGAWLTAESERWRLLHVTLGYTMAGLVAFRIVWGMVGTRHARFSAFVRGPRAVAAYLGSLLRGRPEHHAGHNPAGALAIVAMLGLAMLVAATGWLTYNDVASHVMEDIHEAAATTMLALVLVHLAAVVSGSLLHGENLVRAMVTGRKTGAAGEGIRRAWRSVAAVMLASVLSFWWLQWEAGPSGGAVADRHLSAVHKADADDDHD
jgi:cytochrome b